MTVGDLVTLSSYGRRRVRASWIQGDDVGLVVRVIKYDHGNYPDDYEVQWRISRMSRRTWEHERLNTRKDLKFVKLTRG